MWYLLDLPRLEFGTFQFFSFSMKVACKRRISVNSGLWLRRFDDVNGVRKTDIFR